MAAGSAVFFADSERQAECDSTMRAARWLTGRTYEKDGVIPHFRGIFDDSGRIMVMINFNSDLGDAWEWADVPYYPEKYANAALRLGTNYVIYSMTH